VLPEVHFTLAESIQKKARFLEIVPAALSLPNVTVVAHRAEDVLKTETFDLVTARAFAPIPRTLDLLKGARLLLYKGPDVEREIAEVKKSRASIGVVMRYDLPDRLGIRTIVLVEREEVRLAPHGQTIASVPHH
jgi:16S rRNA (guanine527-N7)-methyltransferase